MNDTPVTVNPISGTEKTCTRCQEAKPLSEFYKSDRCVCKACKSARDKEWKKNNPERVKKLNKDYRENNSERIKESIRQWIAENYDKWMATKRRWNIKNKDKTRVYGERQYAKERSTPKGLLACNTARAINKSLQTGAKAGRHWEDLVGYTVDQLKKHLEKHFRPGMSWANYGEWHIDHIIPKAAFNFETPEDLDFRRCWALKNLQPLWASENNFKRAKIGEPFQPSLLLVKRIAEESIV